MHLDQLKRREFITLLGGGVASWPLAATLISPAHAQAPKPRLATLSPSSQTASAARWGAFWEGMQALGHSRDDFVVENRWGDGHPDRLSGLAAELVRLNPQIIVCYGSEATLAAKQATTSIPVVIAVSADPIGAGLAASLARPGGNVTGLSMQQPEMAGKHVELLKRVVPQAKRIAVLLNPHDPTHPNRADEIIRAAGSTGIEAFSVAAAVVEQIAGAFAEMTSRNADALIVLGTPLFTQAGAEIVELAARQGLPALYDTSSFVAIGGLITYGADPNDLFRRAAYYVDKILKGAKPADLPIQQPTKFFLLINLKTAKALGLTIPRTLLALADEVIE
jgi:putative tryptophan/tyrosine transport system substrate-binding protein